MQEEYDRLLAVAENREVTRMGFSFADKAVFDGMKKLLLSQMETRFGAVPADRKQRIEAIRSEDEMVQLADRLLVARSLDDLEI